MKRSVILTAAAILILTSPAWAQRPFGVHGIGPRAGVTINPDQVHFGGHLDLGDLAPQLMLFPNLDIGLGNDITVVTPTFELDFRFRKDWGSWNPYVGGGIGPVFVSHNRGGSNTELGLAVQGGIAHQLTQRTGFLFVECKLGLKDYPDAKFTIGWSFGTSKARPPAQRRQ